MVEKENLILVFLLTTVCQCNVNYQYPFINKGLIIQRINMSISNPKSLTTMCLSKPKSALSTQSANVRKTNTLYNNQRYWNRRCQTAVSKPHRHDRRMVEACSYHVVRQMDLEVLHHLLHLIFSTLLSCKVACQY